MGSAAGTLGLRSCLLQRGPTRDFFIPRGQPRSAVSPIDVGHTEIEPCQSTTYRDLADSRLRRKLSGFRFQAAEAVIYLGPLRFRPDIPLHFPRPCTATVARATRASWPPGRSPSAIVSQLSLSAGRDGMVAGALGAWHVRLGDGWCNTGQGPRRCDCGNQIARAKRCEHAATPAACRLSGLRFARSVSRSVGDLRRHVRA